MGNILAISPSVDHVAHLRTSVDSTKNRTATRPTITTFCSAPKREISPPFHRPFSHALEGPKHQAKDKTRWRITFSTPEDHSCRLVAIRLSRRSCVGGDSQNQINQTHVSFINRNVAGACGDSMLPKRVAAETLRRVWRLAATRFCNFIRREITVLASSAGSRHYSAYI